MILGDLRISVASGWSSCMEIISMKCDSGHGNLVLATANKKPRRSEMLSIGFSGSKEL